MTFSPFAPFLFHHEWHSYHQDQLIRPQNCLRPGFSQDFGLLKTDKEHPAVEGVREQSLFIGTMQKLPWAFTGLAQAIENVGKLGFQTSFQSFLDWCSQELEARRQVSHRRFFRLDDPNKDQPWRCAIWVGVSKRRQSGDLRLSICSL